MAPAMAVLMAIDNLVAISIEDAVVVEMWMAELVVIGNIEDAERNTARTRFQILSASAMVSPEYVRHTNRGNTTCSNFITTSIVSPTEPSGKRYTIAPTAIPQKQRIKPTI